MQMLFSSFSILLFLIYIQYRLAVVCILVEKFYPFTAPIVIPLMKYLWTKG